MSLILVFLVSARSKTKIQFNGREYASADEMPVSVRAAYDHAIGETPLLHFGARLAAKLQTKIILNDTEFNHPGEMSVDDRHLYHEALEALFPPNIAIAAGEPAETNGKKGSPFMGSVKKHLSQAARVLRLKR